LRIQHIVDTSSYGGTYRDSRPDSPNNWIENIVNRTPGKTVTLLYDNSDDIYEIVIEGQATGLTYKKTHDFLLNRAKGANTTYASVEGWVIYIIMLLIGIASSRFRSRYEQERA
jgi:hypothetical protein